MTIDGGMVDSQAELLPDDRLEFLRHLHEYVTLLRTESQKRMAISLGTASALMLLLVSQISYQFQNHMLGVVSGGSSALGVFSSVLIFLHAWRILYPLVTDSKSVMIPDGILRGFETWDRFDDHVRGMTRADCEQAIVREVYAVARAEDARKRSLRALLRWQVPLLASIVLNTTAMWVVLASAP